MKGILMANDPIPNVVVASGPKASAPGGAIPIALYGAGLPAYAFPSALGTAGPVLTVNPAGPPPIWTTPA